MSDRTLVLASPHMTGADVSGCQADLNTRLAAWKVPKVVDVDGDWGMISRDTAASVLYGLGVDKGGDFDGVSPLDRLKIRYGWDYLTPEEKVLQRAREDWRARLADNQDGSAVKAALDWAGSVIGVTESPPGSNRGTTIDAWERKVQMLGGPWCGAYANAVLTHGGFPDQFWLRYCPWIEQKAKAGEGGWAWISLNAKAQPGDLVLYGFGEAKHVGVVEEVNTAGDDTATLEGNTSNGPGGDEANGGIVARRHRHTDGSLGGFPIRGYARPPW